VARCKREEAPAGGCPAPRRAQPTPVARAEAGRPTRLRHRPMLACRSRVGERSAAPWRACGAGGVRTCRCRWPRALSFAHRLTDPLRLASTLARSCESRFVRAEKIERERSMAMAKTSKKPRSPRKGATKGKRKPLRRMSRAAGVRRKRGTKRAGVRRSSSRRRAA